MEKLFTIKGLKLDNKNICFFNSDMFEDRSGENKFENKFVAYDEETLMTFLCASLDSMCTDSGLSVSFMNDNTCFIAIQVIGKMGKMNTTEFIKKLNDFINNFDITHMTILQQSKYNDEEFYFISDKLN